MTARIPAELAARFAADLIEDCVAQGLASQWRKRAAVFSEWCRPRPQDFPGRAPCETVEERAARLDAMAQACLNRAAVIELERAG